MAKCTFFGHREIYDLDLAQRLTAAVKKVLSAAHEVEFLFYGQGEFYDLCLTTVLEMKHRHPDRVKLTLLLPIGDGNDIAPSASFLFDSIVPIRLMDSRNFVLARRKAIRSYILNSDYMITYYYAALRDEKAPLLSAIEKQPHIVKFDLTTERTSLFIQGSMKRLGEENQMLLQRIDNGEAYSALAEEQGVTVSAIRARENKGHKQLRMYVHDQLYRKRTAQGFTSPVACVMLLSGPIRDLSRFENAVHFLTERCGVSEFLVGALSSHNAYAARLYGLTAARPGVEMTAYVDAFTHSKPNDDELKKDFAPMYSRVIRIDTGATTIRSRTSKLEIEMLGKSEYVICDSDKNADLYSRVQRQIDKFKHLKVIDLGKTPRIEEAHN